MKCKTYEEWLEYYENATKEQVIEDVKHDNDHILELNHLASERKEEIDRLNEELGDANYIITQLHKVMDKHYVKKEDYDRLNNIIDELEKYTIEQINIVKENMQIIGNEGKRMATRFVVYNEYLDKLKELKEEKNEQK